MSGAKIRYENMLFAYTTTSSKDYQNIKFEPSIRTEYKPRPKKSKSLSPPEVKDLQTMRSWVDEVPFYLLHKPRPIVGTNPWTVPKYNKPSAAPNHESVIKTRPRRLISPALPLDDVTEERARALLCADTYTTVLQAAAKKISELKPQTSLQAPMPIFPAPANPIFIPKLKPPLVSPEWRADTVHWDNDQLRAHTEHTKRFWLNYEHPNKKKNIR